MEKKNSSGFREVEHTADLALEVWAPDLEGLFTQAAAGMYRLMGIQLEDEPAILREVEVDGVDLESLLISFLSELLYRGETQQVACERIQVRCDGTSLRAQCAEKRIHAQSRLIKAATYHDLAISQVEDQWNVRIVFDV